MKLLSLFIFILVVILAVELSIAKKTKKNPNSILPLDDQDDSDSEDHLKDAKKKKAPVDDEDDGGEEDEGEDDPIFACYKKKDSVCTCETTGETKTLDCTKQTFLGEPLDQTDVTLRDHEFVPTIIKFNNNNIKTLEYGIVPGSEYEAVELDLSNNHIPIITRDAFNKFTSLLKLKLSSNELKSLSKQWLNARLGSVLHQLYLDDNKIAKITPSNFEEMKELQVLILDGNPNIVLSTFSKTLSNLNKLSLDRCEISKMDSKLLQNLVNLKHLSLRGNPLTTIPKAINAIPNLSALDLSETELTEIDTDEISSDHNLTEFYASNMKYLYNIHDCSFCGLTKLEKVVLSKNPQLYYIDQNAFGYMTAEKDRKYALATLQEFDISNSNFSTLPEKLFDWTKVEVLKLDGNPYNCTCDLGWLINNKDIHLKTNPECAEPSDLNGTLFTKASVCKAGGRSIFMWAFVTFLTVFGLIGGVLLYTRRIRVTNVFYRAEVPQMGYSNLTAQQPRDDEDELREDFETRPDATPV